jgi:hypothetical protein
MLDLMDNIQPKRRLGMSFFQYVEERFLLREGLITSYGKDKLKSNLFWDFGKNIQYVEDVPIYKSNKKTKFGTPNTLTFIIKNLEDFNKEEFLKRIDTYGYFLVKNEKYEDNKEIFQIEPKYPIEIEKKEFEGSRIFHVTSKKNLEKIKKIGLVAKESTTPFPHPNNRIYFFATNDPEKYIPRLKDVISKGKKDLDDYIVFEILVEDLPAEDVYLDESFEQNFGNYFAFFVLDDIAPYKLKLTEF